MNILSSQVPDPLADVAEPTDADLAAIEAEWPSIAVELKRLDDEASRYASGHVVQVHRRTRRRTRRVLVKAVAA